MGKEGGGAFPWEGPGNGVLAQVLPTALLSELLHLAQPQVFSGVTGSW